MGGRPMEIGNRRRDKKRGGALFMQAGRLVFLFTGVFGLLLLLYSSRSYALGQDVRRLLCREPSAGAICTRREKRCWNFPQRAGRMNHSI